MIFGETNDVVAQRLETWHDWFAWYPVCLLDGRVAWLQKVQRCRRWSALDDCFFVYGVNEKTRKNDMSTTTIENTTNDR